LRPDAVHHQELRRQLQGGARRLRITCPFPKVVHKDRRKVATPPDLPEGQVPALRLK
jgi:hypothetical protein